jgi:cytochrome b
MNIREIRVWDIGVRLFHWSLVAAFITSYLSDELHDLHTWSGYAVIALIIFRILWGFVGTQYARFSHFIYPPGEVMNYLKGLAHGSPPHYTGHNPAGGWMIFLLLITLGLVCFSGLKALAIEGDGPLAADIRFSLIANAYAHGNEKHEKKPQKVESINAEATKPASPLSADSVKQADMAGIVKEEGEVDEGESFWKEAHELLVDIMLVLVGIHILGVVVSGRLHRENLVRAMITGSKRQSLEPD